jgi:hypothetical protein
MRCQGEAGVVEVGGEFGNVAEVVVVDYRCFDVAFG